MRVRAPLLLVAAIAASSCARPWATVPTTYGGIPACTDEDFPRQTVCDWAAGFDDLLLFNIDERLERFEPLQTQSGGPVAANAQCRIVDPAIVLVGTTSTSSMGHSATEIIIPGDNEVTEASMLAPGTRALVPVVANDNRWVRVPRWPVVENDVVTFAGPLGCSSASDVIGLSPDQLLAAVDGCTSPAVAEIRDGAVCFPPEPE